MRRSRFDRETWSRRRGGVTRSNLPRHRRDDGSILIDLFLPLHRLSFPVPASMGASPLILLVRRCITLLTRPAREPCSAWIVFGLLPRWPALSPSGRPDDEIALQSSCSGPYRARISGGTRFILSGNGSRSTASQCQTRSSLRSSRSRVLYVRRAGTSQRTLLGRPM